MSRTWLKSTGFPRNPAVLARKTPVAPAPRLLGLGSYQGCSILQTCGVRLVAIPLLGNKAYLCTIQGLNTKCVVLEGAVFGGGVPSFSQDRAGRRPMGCSLHPGASSGCFIWRFIQLQLGFVEQARSAGPPSRKNSPAGTQGFSGSQ